MAASVAYPVGSLLEDELRKPRTLGLTTESDDWRTEETHDVCDLEFMLACIHMQYAISNRGSKLSPVRKAENVRNKQFLVYSSERGFGAIIFLALLYSIGISNSLLRFARRSKYYPTRNAREPLPFNLLDHHLLHMRIPLPICLRITQTPIRRLFVIHRHQNCPRNMFHV